MATRSVFVEGYDPRNWGDVLMAISTLHLLRDASATHVLPRSVAGQPDNYFDGTGLTGRTRFASPLEKILSLGWKQGAFVPGLSAARAKPGDIVLYVNGYIFGDG